MTKVIGTLCDCENTPRKERMTGVVVRDATYILGRGGELQNLEGSLTVPTRLSTKSKLVVATFELNKIT